MPDPLNGLNKDIVVQGAQARLPRDGAVGNRLADVALQAFDKELKSCSRTLQSFIYIIYVCTGMYTYMCICVYIYIEMYIQTHRLQLVRLSWSRIPASKSLVLITAWGTPPGSSLEKLAEQVMCRGTIRH